MDEIRLGQILSEMEFFPEKFKANAIEYIKEILPHVVIKPREVRRSEPKPQPKVAKPAPSQKVSKTKPLPVKSSPRKVGKKNKK